MQTFHSKTNLLLKYLSGQVTRSPNPNNPSETSRRQHAELWKVDPALAAVVESFSDQYSARVNIYAYRQELHGEGNVDHDKMRPHHTDSIGGGNTVRLIGRNGT